MPFSGMGAAAISAIGGWLTNKQNAEYNAEEAQKNRDFQREMYERQYEDSIKFWNMQNQYNLPSAQVERLKDANLNPLLMYGQGGTSLTSQSQAQLPSQPSGSQARASFTNPLEMAQYALLDAQREKLSAETDKIRSEYNAQELENSLSRALYDVRKSMEYKHYDFLVASTNKLYRDMVNNGQITYETVETMRQARLYETKRFDLDFNTQAVKLQQGWKSLEYEGVRAAQGWRQLAIDAGRLFNETNMTNQQLGMLRWSLLKDKAMFGLEFDGLSLDNKLKRWDTHLKRATLNEKQVNIWNQELKNHYLYNYGSEEVKGGHIMQEVNSMSRNFDMNGGLHRPKFQDIYVLPWNR